MGEINCLHFTWLVKNFFHQPKKLPRNKKFCADEMEGDAELNALRQKRMAEMQAQGGGPMGGGGGDQQKKAQERQEQVMDMKNSILSQVLSQEARARLNTILIAKPEKGAQVENAIIQMAQSGQLGGKLSDEELVGLLERFSGASQKSSVKFDRRRNAMDSDED